MTAPTTAKPYHHGNLRAALIEAGLAALETADSGDVSLRALAREIGVSANAAYRHFKDKDALLSALAAEGFRRFAAKQAESMQGHAELMTARRASGRAYVDFARANPALFRLMFGHFLHAKADADLRESAMHAFQGLLSASAQEAGTAATDQLALLTAVLSWSIVHGLSHLLLDGQLDFFAGDLDTFIDDVLSLPPRLAQAQAAAQSSKSTAAAKTQPKAKAAKLVKTEG
jgi:AcrR family transcriptional regulator